MYELNQKLICCQEFHFEKVRDIPSNLMQRIFYNSVAALANISENAFIDYDNNLHQIFLRLNFLVDQKILASPNASDVISSSLLNKILCVYKNLAGPHFINS